MDEIAERAGVSKPVLYQHFPGKLELYLALLDESVDTLVETVRDALRSNPDPKQRVAATFGAYFEYVGGKGQAYRLVFESDLSNEAASATGSIWFSASAPRWSARRSGKTPGSPTTRRTC